MTVRTVQLVLHYDGSAFAGWQRQPDERTVQGELERVLTRLTGSHVAALGAPLPLHRHRSKQIGRAYDPRRCPATAIRATVAAISS